MSDAPTDPRPLEIDTNKLFDFAGMSTNRTEMPANPFGDDTIKEPAANVNASSSATPPNPFGDDIFAAPANQPSAAVSEENKQENDLANFL